MIWPPPAVSLEGSIVTLEPITPEHRGGLVAAGGDQATWTWMPVRGEGAVEAWIDESLAAREDGSRWTLVTIRGEEIVGSSSYLHIPTEHDGAEIGWTWLNPEAWRTGANVEAKLLMMRQCFEELGCMRVEFKTDSRNERSRAAMEGIGATFEGIFRRHMNTPAGIRDSAYFSVIDEEWPDVRAGLERRLERAGDAVA